MAYLNDKTITTMRSLFDAIDTFLTTAGWTQDVAPNGTTIGDAAWSIGSPGECFVQVGWDTENHFDIYQSTGYSGPLSLGNEPGDSSHPSVCRFHNGATDLDLANAELWGFTNAGEVGVTNDEFYAYFVLEYNRDGRYCHFGFGHASKYSTWDGGAFSYGWDWSTSSTQEGEPWGSNHRVLLDSNHQGVSTTTHGGTMTIRNMDGQPASGAWAILTNATTAPATADDDGNSLMKVEGYTRHGPWPSALLHVRGNPNNAFIPIIPIELAAHGSTGSTTVRYMLGKMPDVGVCNIGNIQPKEQIVLGGDTWMFFPWGAKLLNPGTDIMGSRNAGIAYLVLV